MVCKTENVFRPGDANLELLELWTQVAARKAAEAEIDRLRKMLSDQANAGRWVQSDCDGVSDPLCVWTPFA